MNVDGALGMIGIVAGLAQFGNLFCLVQEIVDELQTGKQFTLVWRLEDIGRGQLQEFD